MGHPVAGPWPGLAVPSPRCTSPRWRSGSAGWRRCWPACCGRASRRTTSPPALPRWSRMAFGVGRRARGQRHGAGGARGRVADGAVRHHLRLGARGQAGAGRSWSWARPGSPGSGCSSGWASAGPGPAAGAASPRTRSPPSAARRAAGRGRRGGRAARHAQAEGAAEHVPALRRSVLVEVARRRRRPGAVGRAGRHAAGPVGRRPAGRRAAAAAGQRRAAGQRAGVGRPGPARARTRCTSTSSTTTAG